MPGVAVSPGQHRTLLKSVVQMKKPLSIVWFRQDLRLSDNPALAAAITRNGPVLPVYIWAPEEEGVWSLGAASRWWLHQSLLSLDASLRTLGSQLVIRRGESLSVLQTLVQESGASAVFWNRRYEPTPRERDAKIKALLRARGLTGESFNASLLFEPWDIHNKEGKPFQVFTRFWKTCLTFPEPLAPIPQPASLPAPEQWPETIGLASLGLEPQIDWATSMRVAWQPGEKGAWNELCRFLAKAVALYPDERDRPDLLSTSRLSPYLHFGEISPRQVWHAVREQVPRGSQAAAGAEAYLRQLGWREFAHHLLFHFPHTSEQPLRPEFAAFPWQEDAVALRAWQHGQTGYPLVDAGMRELWATGWMHNRVRMMVASFLVKDLLLPWQAGDRWFWDTLVDADLANNTLGWQWTAGCGADAAPYFRIFHPVIQGEKFDAAGDYVRRWVPELARLPVAWVHKPWEAPAEVLAAAGVKLGRTYPKPIVIHETARLRALNALATIKQDKQKEARRK